MLVSSISRQVQPDIRNMSGSELSGDTDPQVNVVWERCCYQRQRRLDESSTECPFATRRGIEGFAVRVQIAPVSNGQD